MYSNNIRIGIDGRALYGKRAGIGHYVYHLCKELDGLLPNAQFIVYSQKPIELPISSERWVLRMDRFLLAKSVLWLKTRCGRLCKQDELDVFWASATLLPRLGRSVRTVCTVYDLNYIVVPETMSTLHKLSHKLFFKRDVASADKVISISHGTAQRLEDLVGRASDVIIQPSVDECFRPQSEKDIQDCLALYGINSPYILAVATWEPRKNLELLIKTFSNMKADGLLPNHRLVLVGGRGWKDQRLVSLMTSDCDQNILPLGYVPDAHLPPLYAGADIFVFPSIYEGFGIPVLEASVCGTRVVTTDLPELHEAGGSDAIYISPTEVGIREGILTACKMPKKRTEHLDLPTWEEGARIMASVLVGEV